MLTCAIDGLNACSPDSVLEVYRSTDGGIIWNSLGRLQAGLGVGGIVTPGQYFISTSKVRNEVLYSTFPEGQQFTPPAEGLFLIAILNGQPVWGTLDTRVLRSDGSVFLDLGADTQIFRIRSDGFTTTVMWHRVLPSGRAEYYFTLMAGERISATYKLPGLSFAVVRVGDQLFGSVTQQLGGLPSLIDTAAAAIYPITNPSADPAAPPGRNEVVAAQMGPFARVVNTGACLNLREAPGVGARILECVADGVLLRDTGELGDPATGVLWRKVRAPSGVVGWASPQYLEY